MSRSKEPVPPRVGRRTLLGGLVGAGLATAAGVPLLATSAGATGWGTHPVETFGTSVRGRPLRLYTRGDPRAEHRIALVGCIHGNEDDGIPVVTPFQTVTPRADTCFFTIPSVNPDGRAAHTRQNSRGVDLNRNFPGGVHRRGRPFDTYYPGRRDLSEPESRATHLLLRSLRPTVLIWYHQHLDLVDYCGGDRRVHRRYASRTGMRLTQLERYPGSVSTWYHRWNPSATILTVELPAHVPAGLVTRHVAAVRDLAARL